MMCMHYRAYKSSCLNDRHCPNAAKDRDGHKFCMTRGDFTIQTAIRAEKRPVTVVDNGD